MVSVTNTSTVTNTLSPTPSATPTVTISPSRTVTHTSTHTPPVIVPSPTEIPRGKDLFVYFIYTGTSASGGCQPAAIRVAAQTIHTANLEVNLKNVLKELFSYRDEYVAGLYNPLFRSSLRVKEASIDTASGKTVIQLIGAYRPSGKDCDNTAVKAQVWSTIRQFQQVQSHILIRLNGIPFGDFLANDK